MRIHPAAALFPMMPDDELAQLADDIKKNGLIHPIIKDDKEQVVDGRNHLAACDIAGVEPTFESLNGHDPLAFIASANLQRRNLSKGQQAMGWAMLYPEPPKGGRGKKSETVDETSTLFSAKRLQIARAVLHYFAELAQSVMAGTISLDEAFKDVKEKRQRDTSIDEKMERLRTEAPDLAARVEDETDKLTLGEAITLLNERNIQDQRIRSGAEPAIQHLREVPNYIVALMQALDVGAENEITTELIASMHNAGRQLGKLKKYRFEKKKGAKRESGAKRAKGERKL
jgi:hypothetical protein